jgi:predicted exporter
MDRASRKISARLALLAFAALGVAWLARLDYAKKISTDVLDLIPPNEQAPEADLVRGLATDLQARVMLFALRDPGAPSAPPAAAAALFAGELRRSPEFAAALTLEGSSGEMAMGRAIFERRNELLLPTWLGERRREFERTGRPEAGFSSWLAERAAADLEAFLARPEAVSLQKLVERDPLLLTPRLIERARLIAAPGSGAGGQALVWGQIARSPFAPGGQGPVFAAIARAQARMHAAYPAVELRWTGVNRFAAASRTRIQSEIRTLNALSLLAVFGVGCVFVRRAWKMLHLVPVVLLSLLGAWTVSTMVFQRLHILVFVIGALLCGVAIDYGFYIYMQPALQPGESYGHKLRRLLKPLLASCLTTVIGFSLLLFSDLPFIREVGLFVSSGLLCALGAAMLYFAQLDQPFLEARQFGRLPFGGSRGVPSRRSVWPVAALVLAASLAAIGPWRLRWRDDVRELSIPAPELEANESALRAEFGDTPGRTMYLTYGPTVAEARRHLDDFLAYEAKSGGADAASLGLLFPTEGDWRAMPALLGSLGGFAGDFRAALDRHGFVPGAFASFFAEWNSLSQSPPQGNYAALYDDVGRALTGPLALLYDAHASTCWFLTVVDRPSGPSPPAGLFTIGVNQLQSLDNLFTRYRWSALRLSLSGLSLVIASVFVIYPFRRGIRIALIPAGSCFLVFGIFGLLGQTLNLFHLLGAFLGVCLAHNYAIFSSETARSGSPPPVSIRLSALSAATSFSVLALSSIPVVHALGLTVALIVMTALAAVELEPFLRGRRRAP